MKKFMRSVLRHFAIKGQTEHIDPHKKNFLQNRFEDYEQRYVFAARYVKNKKVLDIACGEGYGTHMLSHIAQEVVGVDSEAIAIQHASERYDNCTFIRDDAIAFLTKTKDQFDVIVSFETVEHIKKYARFLELIEKRLKPGGLLLLSTPNKEITDMFFGGVYNPFHVKEFYTDELTELLAGIFHTKPEIYRQGPVSSRNLFLSTIRTYITGKSKIVKGTSKISGAGNVFVVTKGT